LLEEIALRTLTSVQATHVSIDQRVSKVLPAAIHAHAGRATATVQVRPAATAKKTWTCVFEARAKMMPAAMKTPTKPGLAGAQLVTKKTLPVQTQARHASNVVWT
jgi:hypothetical protein